MDNLIFLIISGLVLVNIMGWGFTHLPRERWQMLAVVPLQKNETGKWLGINLTYYGFFIATSELLALGLLIILLASMGISLLGTLVVTAIMLLFCVPSARIIARLVEKKQHTFTVGGASFVGIVLAPILIVATEKMLSSYYYPCYMPLMPIMAAMAIAYSLGEGLGRLACLSYGCCYGKPVRDCCPLLQRLFARTGHIFDGDIKKAVYESDFHGERLVPIQSITCILYTFTALVGSGLFLAGHFTWALLLCILVTQAWRFFSEIFRADFRGYAKISVYQKMGLTAIVYILCITLIGKPDILVESSITRGVASLWDPLIIVGLQLAWLVFFIYFGRSTVTSSTVSYTLHLEKI